MSRNVDALSPRQELLAFTESGGLRDETAGRLSSEATDLLVRVVTRYCEPRKVPAWRRHHKGTGAFDCEVE